MKHNFKYKLIAIIFIMLLVFPIFSSNTHAAINEGYLSRHDSTQTEINVDDVSKDSNILDMLAIFVYSLAGLVENIVGIAFQSLTGTNDFPWADRILFNSVPLLDVNFFNPHDNSLFSQNNDILGTIVRNTYFTILSIAVAFLGIIVAIAAIKMAISSLASEKAKYKEALTKWLFSIVMLFLIHNLMAFVFFVNEKMVEVASSLVTDTLDKTNLLANIENLESYVGMTQDEAIDRFLTANKSNLENMDWAEDIINSHKDIAYKLLASKSYQDSVLFDAFGNETHVKRNWFKEGFTGNGKQSMAALARDVSIIAGDTIEMKDFNFGSFLLGTSAEGRQTKLYINLIDPPFAVSTHYDDLKNGGLSKVYDDYYTEQQKTFFGIPYAVDKYFATDGIKITMDDILNGKDNSKTQAYYVYNIMMFLSNDTSKIKTTTFYNSYISAMTNTYARTTGVGKVTASSPDVLSSLAEYFKTTAYTFETDDKGNTTGWKPTKLTIQGALLYAIFVFQSIMYFFAYIRRFFYIVVLAIMAPAIVVIDFLSKAVS